MNRKFKTLLLVITFVVVPGLQTGGISAFAQGMGIGQRSPLQDIPIKGDTARTLSKYFIESSVATKAPDNEGFIQRWLVLEPVEKNISRNNIFTEQYLRTTLSTDNFSENYTVVLQKGEKVRIGNQELKWYTIDTKTFNFNLYHFTYAINKPNYGILVWLVTVINCPEEIENVRMAAGANSSSMWWLNGNEVLMLSGDRDMIADNVASARLTLKKGRNIIRGAVINGPGMANFCVRFLHENGAPVKNFSISYE